MKAELSLRDKFKSDTPHKNFSNNNNQPNYEKFKPAANNFVVLTNKFNEDKAMRKEKEKEATKKEVQKNPITYAKPYQGKWSLFNQLDHTSSNCPLRNGIHMVEKGVEEEDEYYCEENGEDEGYGDYEYELTHQEGDICPQNRKMRLTDTSFLAPSVL